VHKLTVARRTLREYEPVDTLFPSAHLPTRKAAAQARLAELLEHEAAEL
jgi:acyl-CoA dehydrogenase